ncbi:MAG: pentapeptide repeat-containing protein [Gammaproteobacteria bacterium]
MVDFKNQDVYIDQNFSNIHLLENEIMAKEFDSCLFDACHFNDTKFINCKFYECKFVNCNLSMIGVKGCSFFDVVFEDTKAIGINWTEAAWPRIRLSSPFKFTKCILNHSSFFGLGLKEIVMHECIAKEVDFRDADCTEANFSYTDFANSLFGKTNLTKADFSEAISYDIDIFNNEIKKAKFCLPEATRLLNCLDIELVD